MASGASHSPPPAVTLSLCMPPLRKRLLHQLRGSRMHRLDASIRSRCRSRRRLPHRPSEHSIMRSPNCKASGPARSSTGLAGDPRQVNSMLRLGSAMRIDALALAAAPGTSGRGCGPATHRCAQNRTASRRSAPSTQPRPAPLPPPRWCAGRRQRLVCGIAQDAAGAPAIRRRVDEAPHVGQRRAGLFLEQRGHGLQRQLRRHLAFGMPAHTVGQAKRRQSGRCSNSPCGLRSSRVRLCG